MTKARRQSRRANFRLTHYQMPGHFRVARRVRRQEPAMSIYRFRALIVLPLETSRHRDKDSNTNDWSDGRLARPEWARVARRQAQGD